MVGAVRLKFLIHTLQYVSALGKSNAFALSLGMRVEGESVIASCLEPHSNQVKKRLNLLKRD